MNQCQLMGRLVRDPELKYTPQGTAVTSFTLAVDRRFNRDKAVEIVADSVYFADAKKESAAGSYAESAMMSEGFEVTDEDIPF